MRITDRIRRVAAAAHQAEGITGVGLVAAGAGIQFGIGWALLVAGAFLVFAAWGRS